MGGANDSVWIRFGGHIVPCVTLQTLRKFELPDSFQIPFSPAEPHLKSSSNFSLWFMRQAPAILHLFFTMLARLVTAAMLVVSQSVWSQSTRARSWVVDKWNCPWLTTNTEGVVQSTSQVQHVGKNWTLGRSSLLKRKSPPNLAKCIQDAMSENGSASKTVQLTMVLVTYYSYSYDCGSS